MKKIVLSLAGVMAAVAFAPEASALPAFARQTGMACSACHNQHFPVLNGFGRAFKAAGYTMMGAQEKVEGEHLSIPAVMNAAILAKVRYQKDNTAKAPAGAALSPADGQLQFGDEFSLFFGGRVAENIGFLFEGNTAAVGGALLAGFKLPINIETSAANFIIVPFTTDALDAQYGYELSSGGVMRANRWAEHRRETSAIQYNAGAGAATGVTLAAKNDMGFAAYTRFSPNFAMGANGGGVPTYSMGSNLFRIAATPEVAGFSLVTGVSMMNGTGYAGGALVPSVTEQTYFDLQAQGALGDNELSIYAQYAIAPKTDPVTGMINEYNAGGTADRKAFTIGADYSLIPHVLHLGGAYRKANTGAVDPLTLANLTDNAITATVVYDLVQNVALHINHSEYNGSSRANVPFAPAQRRLTTFMLEAAW
ncbi:MAG: hypothetical protein PHI29_10150 [Gallionella sp.]|nr:hypothetical protein [Gallionella sp.]